MKKLLIGAILMIATASNVFAMTYKEAKVQDKPMVVMFHTHTCSACRKFSPLFKNMSSKFSDKFNFIKEDANSSELSKTLNFMTVPAIFIVQPKTMSSKRISDDCAWDEACFASTLKSY